MSKEVFDTLNCFLVVAELEPEERIQVSKALNCQRGGHNPKTLKTYISMTLENEDDWNRANKFMQENSKKFNNIRLSYSVFSKLSWGAFIMPKRAIEFSNKYGCDLLVNYATPPEK